MSDIGTSNKNVIWGWAAAAGVVAILVLMFVLSYGFWPALVLSVLIAFLVAILVWIGFYREEAGDADLTSGKTASSSETAPVPEQPAPVAQPKPVAEKPASGMMGDAGNALKAANEGKPAALKSPRNGKADDLKKIKGIGPKLEELLHSLGFYHYDQIAGWNESEVAWVDNNLTGFKGRVSRDNWVEQAATLAAGGQTEFSMKVDKGGVY